VLCSTLLAAGTVAAGAQAGGLGTGRSTVGGFAAQAGRTVVVPYTVTPGDTLNAIARRFGVPAHNLAEVNALANANLIYVGQVLSIPVAARGGWPSFPVPAPGPFNQPALTGPGGTTPSATTVPSTTVPPGPTTTVPTPPPGGAPPPPGTPATLPVSLFGVYANDPARLALVPLFDRWADTYRISRPLLKGLSFVESSWRADALSSAGAVGIGQLMPDTSRWIADVLIGDPSLDPNKAADNIRMSARYIRWLLDQTGNEYTAIASYYQGIGSVERTGIQPGTHQYVARVQGARAAFG
jgi:LysM repeat protein